jgi:hypothetical protein
LNADMVFAHFFSPLTQLAKPAHHPLRCA